MDSTILNQPMAGVYGLEIRDILSKPMDIEFGRLVRSSWNEPVAHVSCYLKFFFVIGWQLFLDCPSLIDWDIRWQMILRSAV